MVDTTDNFNPQTESIDQYNARITSYNASKNDSLSTNNLSSTESLTVPPPQTPAPSQPSAAASHEALLAGYNQQLPEEQNQNTLQSEIFKSLGIIGTETTRKSELEKTAGLPGQRQDLQNVINQLQGLQKEALAIPLQIQQEYAGRGATAAGVAPIETSRLRENAIKSLSLAAIGQTLQGNIALADANIKSALEAEFGPEKAKLETLKQLYEFNRDALTRADKKRTDNLNILLAERERLLKTEEKNRESIYNIGLEAARAGAPMDFVSGLNDSETREEALSKAAPYLSLEAKQRIEQQNFQNSLALRNLQINEAQLRLSQNKQAIEQAQKEYDLEFGILDQKELSDVDSSPQGKKVKSLGDLSLKLSAYRELIKQYGTASVGEQKSKLDAAYNDLKIAYKEAANLGAIQAPDVPIIEGALRDATYANPVTQAFSKLTGRGKINSIDAGLEQAAVLIQSSGQTNVNQLLARNPKYSNSGYVQALVLPLLSTKTTVKIGGQDVAIGSIIENAQGQKARVNADGSVTPL